jgi:hypothetical protein
MGLRALGAIFLAMTLTAAQADEASLRARFAQSQPPMAVESSDDGHRVMGEIYAVLPQPFEAASAALKDPASWCEILLLHLETKECRVARDNGATVLQAGVVTHYDQPAASAFRVEFNYRLAYESPDYIEARLDAPDGPLDTTDFRIVFEALRTPDGRMFAHMAYAYGYGPVSHIALELYLVTFGRGKVGFTVVGTEPDGAPRYVGGMRGVVERNTVRYYLAVDAWLAATGATRSQRVENALHNWYAAVERYPRQLHEVSEERYLAQKRMEMGVR